MDFEKRGQLKTFVSLLAFISILFLSVFAVNQSLNQTNNSLQDNSFNITPEVNISIDVSMDITNTNISEDIILNISDEADIQIPQNISIVNETEEGIIENETEIIDEDEEEIEINESMIVGEIDGLMINEKIREHKNKLNKKTENYLESIEDIKEKRNYIIKFKQSIDEGKLEKVKLEERYNKFKTVKIRAEAEDISGLLSDLDVEYLELDQKIETLSDNIPYGINKTNAPSVWSKTTGGGVKVAILDTGISSHTDLTLAGGTSIISNDYTDHNGHGTAVSGVISALLNDGGIVGVAPESEIYAVKIMESSTGDLSNGIAGVEWAIENDMQIISMSFGMETYSQIFKEVLEETYSSGILLIAASGNNGEDILYPAAYSSVIAVGATDESDERASFSSYGNELELVAPGVNINSTALENSYDTSSGTSMAAPHVSGVAALVWAYNNSLTNEEIRAKLRNDALDLGSEGKDYYYGYGSIQVNLESQNFTAIDDNYFYEVFNITIANGIETITFWVNGTGVIEDIDFPHGLYIIKRYYDNHNETQRYNIPDQNGLIFSLTECGSTPTDGCTVSQNTSFNQGTYNLPSGINMGASNIVLNCNNSILIGDKSGNGITLGSGIQSVTVENCELNNYSSGIRLDGWVVNDVNIVIRNNTLNQNSYGIYVLGSRGNDLVENTISNSTYGILLNKVESLDPVRNNISNNIIFNNSRGIYISNSDYNNVSGNTLSNNSYIGIEVYYSSTGNTIWNNNLYGTGITYDNTDNNYCVDNISNNYFDGATGPTNCSCLPPLNGIYVDSDVTFCVGIYKLGSGIEIAKSGVELDCNNNVFFEGSESGNGITIGSGVQSVTVENCELNNYSSGIKLDGWVVNDVNIVIRNNTLNQNSYGIYVLGSRGNDLVENTISNSTYGILLNKVESLDPVRNNISNNIIFNNSRGIYISNSDYNNVSGNTLSNNSYIGIEVYYSSTGNTIWNNNLYGTGITYDNTDNNYCVDNIPNNYFDGATGPTNCSCLPPLNGIYVDSNVTFCVGTYKLGSGIEIAKSGVELDCNNNVFFEGSGGSSDGITIDGHSSVTVRNCVFTNYSDGLYMEGGVSSLNNLIESNNFSFNYIGMRLRLARSNTITNNTIKNNTNYGIILEHISEMGSIDNTIHFNNIFDNSNYDFFNNQADNVSAENNCWGTAIDSEIEGNIFDFYDNPLVGVVDFDPFLTGPSCVSGMVIKELIPIQVIGSVNLVKGKSGIVRVVVANNGPLDANATVNVTFDGNLLDTFQGEPDTKLVLVGQTQTFDFSFNPSSAGTSEIKAEVSEE